MADTLTSTRTTSILATLLLTSSRQSPYFAKDLRKANNATQFIGQGSIASSTNAYAKAAHDLANTGTYTTADTIFISAEGARSNRFNPIGTAGPRGAYRNIGLAIRARASFIIDRPADRARPYNVGERQIEAYLLARGHIEVRPGVFTPIDPAS